MKDLMLVMAAILPTEKIVEEIKDRCIEFLETGSDESRNKVESFCALLLSKRLTDKKDISEISKDMSEMERITERMNSKTLS